MHLYIIIVMCTIPKHTVAVLWKYFMQNLCEHREQPVQSKGYRCTHNRHSSAVEIFQMTLPLSIKTQELYSWMRTTSRCLSEMCHEPYIKNGGKKGGRLFLSVWVYLQPLKCSRVSPQVLTNPSQSNLLVQKGHYNHTNTSNPILYLILYQF